MSTYSLLAYLCVQWDDVTVAVRRMGHYQEHKVLELSEACVMVGFIVTGVWPFKNRPSYFVFTFLTLTNQNCMHSGDVRCRFVQKCPSSNSFNPKTSLEQRLQEFVVVALRGCETSCEGVRKLDAEKGIWA